MEGVAVLVPLPDPGVLPNWGFPLITCFGQMLVICQLGWYERLQLVYGLCSVWSICPWACVRPLCLHLCGVALGTYAGLHVYVFFEGCLGGVAF